MKKKLQKQLDTLLKLMGIDTHYDIEEEKVADTTYIKVSFKGENLGYLIGGHGRHLDSLQFILNLMLRKEFGEDSGYRVLLDVADYRKGRDEKLEKFAMQKADDARILGEPVDLPPMKASDRRVIHIALEKFDDIKTESVGEDRDRHIRIIPVSDSDILEDSGSETEEEESEE